MIELTLDQIDEVVVDELQRLIFSLVGSSMPVSVEMSNAALIVLSYYMAIEDLEAVRQKLKEANE